MSLTRGPCFVSAEVIRAFSCQCRTTEETARMWDTCKVSIGKMPTFKKKSKTESSRVACLSEFCKNLSNTKSQPQSLSGRRLPIAGATGASTKEGTSPEARTGIPTESPGADSYGIHFIQHSPEPLEPVNKCPVAEYPHKERQPEEGFALKKSGGKRVLFTVAQKEIMMEFYERSQATRGIRANPKDAAEVMKQRGIEPLKESQIRSWWSTYHQKRKAALNTLTQEANSLATQIPHAATDQTMASPVPLQQSLPTTQGSTCTMPVAPLTSATPTAPQTMASTVPIEQCRITTWGNAVPVTSATHTAPRPIASTVPVQHPRPTTRGNAVPVTSSTHTTPKPMASTVPVQHPRTRTRGNAAPVTSAAHTAPQTMASTAPVPSVNMSYLDGIHSLHIPFVVEWHFPLPTNDAKLNHEWQLSLWEAILKGNEIHDDMYENYAVDVDVHDAVDKAGDECGVNCI
ncbi:hypothetical protein OS493_019388 [Desmophyllum pertusum]|uniref:Uncharacterized protein n=1 Tax=Desmophyllum pertusum TaxID=174260 RepID=A0A9X0D8I1_9CNID|nr:hypothetical protein OS493_019388 [Desmophyllum pertusum]